MLHMFQNNAQISTFYHVIKSDDYDLKFFKIDKTIVTNTRFRLKVKTVVDDYDFENFEND